MRGRSWPNGGSGTTQQLAESAPKSKVGLGNAISSLRAMLERPVDVEVVPLSRSHGRVLAAPLVASINVPPQDASAVDGFAVRGADLEQCKSLELVGEATAGHPHVGDVPPGAAVRILTGGAVPRGADWIVPQEICSLERGHLSVSSPSGGKNHIRRRGEDVHQGAPMLPAGHRLRAQDLALACAMGVHAVSVYRQLRVTLFSTGDELCDEGSGVQSGQIWDSNRLLLAGALRRAGCDVGEGGIIKGDPRQIELRLSRAAAHCDLIVTSGGMSVGREDHVRPTIQRRGTLDLWNLDLKPGKPVGFGDIDGCPILALPGNPVAAAVTFAAFGWHVVQHLSGAEAELATLLLPGDFSAEKPSSQTQYLLAKRISNDGVTRVRLLDRQGAAMVSALSESDGWVILRDGTTAVARNTPVEFLPLTSILI